MNASDMNKAADSAWRPIEGFMDRYRISTAGEIQYFNGREWKTMHPNLRRNGNYIVCLLAAPKVHRQMCVNTLVARTFLGGVPDGMKIVHRNGMRTDCSVSNLKFVPKRESSAMGGRASRKPVVKIDRNGTIIDAYSSIKEAGKANHICGTSVRQRCKKRIKDEFDLLGFSFRYEK